MTYDPDAEVFPSGIEPQPAETAWARQHVDAASPGAQVGADQWIAASG